MPTKSNEALDKLLSLQPLVGTPLSFLQFLTELKDNPERAATAAGLLVRAVKSKGEVSDKELDELERTEPERARYFRMLKRQGIPLYKAFLHVRGSQRTVARIMKFLEAAAANGYQLRQLLVIIGGPGSGKSYLMDAFKAVLEGEEVFVVEGCPVHENPLNLLKLLAPETLKQLSDQLGMGDTLTELLKVAGEPCEHCFAKAQEAGDGKPSLANVKVLPMRLSSRNAGVSTWMPSSDGQGCSLLTALRQGSRGIVDMPEAFAVAEPAQGSVLELDLLLDATEYRRVPNGGHGTCSKVAGTMPLDAVLMAQSNEGAFRRFIKAQNDPKRFMRRAIIMGVPYNTAICEEVQAYLDFIDVLKVRPHIDPLALRLAATLAVASRMKKESETGVALDTRMRLYNGESIVIPKRASSTSSRVSESDRWAAGLYGTAASTDSTESKNVRESDVREAAGDKEAMEGLSVPLMLSMVSQVCELAMNAKGSKQCISALGMLGYLRQRIEMELKTPELQDVDRKIFESCREWLKELQFKTDTPSLIEKEYRRLLRHQIIEAFAPDYEDRAALMFEVYRTHAKASAMGAEKVFDKRYNKTIDIDVEFLESLERLMGKTTHTERTEFRQALDTELGDKILIQIRELGAAAQQPDWRTLPDLRKAISRKIDDDIAKDVERCLTDEMNLHSEADRKLRRESLERFERFGYCQHCSKTALAYIKEFKLWSTQS